MGVSVDVRVNINVSQLTERVADGVALAQQRLDAMIVEDSNFYCPQETGTLQKSAIIHTKIGSGCVMWKTDYAHKQYYGLSFDHSKGRNPNATARWFETAKAKQLSHWVKTVEQVVKNGI